jgi:hypothetical protein
MRALILVAASMLPAAAHADADGLDVTLFPTLDLLQRHGRMNHGAGVGARGAFGISDLLAVEVTASCDRFRDLVEHGHPYGTLSTSLFYNASRCDLVPGAALTLGAKHVVSLALGAGYRFGSEVDRAVVSAEDVLLDRPSSRSTHDFIVGGRAAYEFRFELFDDLFGAGVSTAWLTPLAAPEVDLSFAVFLAAHLYP